MHLIYQTCGVRTYPFLDCVVKHASESEFHAKILKVDIKKKTVMDR